MAKQGVASMLALALLLGAFAAIPTGVHAIGVCYGVNGDNLPSASDVVQLYRSNGINQMRIYFPDTNALNALSGSNIGVIMDVPNSALSSLASDPSAAATSPAGTPTASSRHEERQLRAGQRRAGEHQGVHGGAERRHAGVPAVAGQLLAGVHGTHRAVPAEHGAPLLCNVYPYFSYTGNEAQIDLSYALFTSPGTVVQDGGNAYQNLFDALVDTFVSALENAGAGNVGVVVSERTYNQNLINHVGQGTPKRPGSIETYIFAMFNEDQKPGAETERHFGLFNPDKSPAYPINFS
ncbi:unnamed protein product [Miscanthus lutarioriparius]|uniref:Glucan endo-1,3-beta-D-glucosidase n=1 Tax=Miscanthus lutarioriparius TaxID=422564 RepID=A0A811SID6_9POAL|nr:unnamed protein product [Miscanthus lutarioriparius]